MAKGGIGLVKVMPGLTAEPGLDSQPSLARPFGRVEPLVPPGARPPLHTPPFLESRARSSGSGQQRVTGTGQAGASPRGPGAQPGPGSLWGEGE